MNHIYLIGLIISLMAGVSSVRAEVLIFGRTNNGNWDNVSNYTPSRLPVAGDTVFCETEIETTSMVFEGHLIISGEGSLRLRGNHKISGSLIMEEGADIRYNTGGMGMILDAPIVVKGDVSVLIESDNPDGSTMTFTGPLSGDKVITVINNGKGVPNTGKLLLSGNNENFSGTWNLSILSEKYPHTNNYISIIEGNEKNSFGQGKLLIAHKNKAIFNHINAINEILNLEVSDEGKVVLQSNLSIGKYILNGSAVSRGLYSGTTNPEIYEGAGILAVGETIQEQEPLPAFPGAEGFGKYVTGGRGGRVIYVTSLEDSNQEGTLRHAVNQSGPRIIMFIISGTIQLKSNLNINNGDVTIAGQTAPGAGITLRDYTVQLNSDNIVIRYLRFRMGDETNQVNDAIWGRNQKDIIIDHCSISWSTDEVGSFYDNENFTLQWSILSEGLRNSVHNKGKHGYGGIWGGIRASFHHNILAHNDSRNPRFNGSRYSNKPDLELVDFRNNTIYNWGSNSIYAGEGGRYNIINNYFKAGPATSSNRGRIIQPYADDGSNNQPSGTYGTFFINGNVVTESSANTANNWLGVNLHSSFNTYARGTSINDIRADSEFEKGEITTHMADVGYEKVLEYGGTSLFRDAVDQRIIYDVTEGTATINDGGNGSTNGLIDTQAATGGWPELESAEAPVDSDNDGIPDAWEEQNSLDKDNPADAQLLTVDSTYPNVEVYMNSLVAHITEGQLKDGLATYSVRKITKHPEPAFIYNNQTRKLFIKHQNSIRLVQVYSLSGTLIQFKTVKETETELMLLNKGIVIVKIVDEKQQHFSQKINLY